MKHCVFFQIKWLQPAMMKGSSCAWRCGYAVLTFFVPTGCSAKCGCSCVRSYRVFWHLLHIAV